MVDRGGSQPWSRRAVLVGATALSMGGAIVSACNRAKPPAEEPTPGVVGPPEGSLEWAVGGSWRSLDRPRDVWRHPMETLRFFGLQPSMTVVDFWPGVGWYTEILAPYLSRGHGKYIAAGFQILPGGDPAQAAVVEAFRQRFSANRNIYGEIEFSAFGPTSGPVAAPGSCDMALFMRNIHAWMAAGIAEKAFSDAFAALRAGGILGIEQHRLDPDDDQDPAATSGYVQEGFVRQLAAEAGFEFVESSEINANERDTKDYPFGVDTLPPLRLSAPRGEAPNPDFDHTKYDEIGESDRMTLKFRKPE
jgi:Predicted methyltransferase